jgi:hypothetical protein
MQRCSPALILNEIEMGTKVGVIMLNGRGDTRGAELMLYCQLKVGCLLLGEGE